MKTVLFIPIGIGLAHTGRLIMIARVLAKKKVKIIFGAGTDAIALVEREGFQYLKIPEFPKEIYNKKMKHNNFFVYSRKVIDEFVKSELDLFVRTKPDLVVYDTRLTARISSEIAGIKTVSIINANMTPYYDFSKVKLSMDTLFSKYIPERILSSMNKKYGQEFFKKIGPKLIQSALIVEMIRMSPSLIKLGYKLKKDPYQLLMGHSTFLTDIPEYRPVAVLPENIKMIGPIFWDGGVKLPHWAGVISKKKNIIYVTAGGTGDKTLFIKILGFLKDSNKTVVATTGNTLHPDEIKTKYKNLYITDYLPGDFIMSRAQLVIFPGGNATCYQALHYGIPQVLTPFHLDQEDNANQLERLGTGKTLNPYNVSREKFIETIEEVLNSPIFKENAIKMQKILKQYNGPKTAAEAILKLLN